MLDKNRAGPKEDIKESIVCRIGGRIAGQDGGARIVSGNRSTAGHAFGQFVDGIIGSCSVDILVRKLRSSVEPVLVVGLLPQLAPPLQ